MNPENTHNAFAKLREYEKRSVRFSPGNKKGDGPGDEWSGVVFGLGGSRLTCHIDRIGEILPCPASSPVPGAKSWIIGLANVRGEILTVVDLNGFLSGDRTPLTANTRLLTASLNKAPIGLLVEEVYGQRHFLDSESQRAELDEDSPLNGVVSRRHDLNSETWLELDLDRLFTTPDFLNGAAE
jgi:twitching motility protein PilI